MFERPYWTKGKKKQPFGADYKPNYSHFRYSLAKFTSQLYTSPCTDHPLLECMLMASDGDIDPLIVADYYDTFQMTADRVMDMDEMGRLSQWIGMNIVFYHFISIEGGKAIQPSGVAIITQQGWKNIAILRDDSDCFAFAWIIPNKKGQLPLLDHLYCLKCWTWNPKKGFAKHIKECYICNCGQRHKQGDGHQTLCKQVTLQERCAKKWGDYKAKIYKTEPTTEFTMANNHFADFEAWQTPRFEVYAAVLVTDSMKNKEAYVSIGRNSFADWINQIMNLKGNLWFHYGGRFDAHLLLKYCIANQMVILEESILRTGSTILSFIIKTRVGELQVKDMWRFTPGTLKDNCRAYKVDQDMSKSEFDHKLITSWEDVEEHSKTILEYVSLDGICMREVFTKYSQVIFETYKLLPCNFMTASHLTYACWSAGLPRSDYLHKTPIEFEKTVRSFYRGGRIVCGRPIWESVSLTYWKKKLKAEPSLAMTKEEYDAIDDYMIYGDVNSLYPSVMAGKRYPVGAFAHRTYIPCQLRLFMEEFNTTNLWERCALKVTVECPDDLNIAFLMERTEKFETVQNLLEKTGWWTGPELHEAQQLGYKIKVLHESLIWPELADLFTAFILKAYKIKSESPRDTPIYMMAKSMMNDLSGKFAQIMILSKYLLIHPEEINTFKSDKKNVTNLDEIIDATGELLGLLVKLNQIKAFTDFPSHLTAFILGWSKVAMSQMLTALGLQKDATLSPLYGDTDSLIFHVTAWERLAENLKTTKKNELGRLKKEINGKIIACYVMAPKCYCVIYVCAETRQVYCKVRCKGMV